MLKKQLSDFEKGYELGVKHAKEYYEALPKQNNKQEKINEKKSNAKTTKELQDDEFNTFMFNLSNNFDKINVYPNYKGQNYVKINELQKKFIRYYQHKRNTNHHVFPVLKMRAGGMTTILQEIAFKEYLVGKKILYISPKPELTRNALQQFTYKKEVSQYIPLIGATIDCVHVNGNNYHIGFSNATIAKRYDLIIVDELSLDTDLTTVLKVVCDYCEYTAEEYCKAIVAFTPNQHNSNSENIQRTLEEYEFEGNLFKYSELSIDVLKRLNNSLRHFFFSFHEDGDFWTTETETILQPIRECLGIQ